MIDISDLMMIMKWREISSHNNEKRNGSGENTLRIAY